MVISSTRNWRRRTRPSGPRHWVFTVCRDRAEALEMMLTKSNDANVINFKLRTVLHVAVYEESLRSVDLLLKHSASVNAQVDNTSSFVFDTYLLTYLSML